MLAVGIVVAFVVEMRAIARLAGGGAEVRTGLTDWLGHVRQGPGIREKASRWQDFVFGLRVVVQRSWFHHTETSTAAATVAEPDQEVEGPESKGPDRRVVAVVAVLLIAGVIALVLWLSGDDDDTVEPAQERQADEPRSQAEEEASADPAPTGDDDDAPPTFEGDGPELTEPVLLRWTNESERGPQPDSLLLVDGDRELRNDAGVLQYREGDRGVLCFGEGDTQTCVPETYTEPLANLSALGSLDVPELPGVETESRTFAGREAFCVRVPIPGDDVSYTFTCTDLLETGMTLLLESKNRLLTGEETLYRQELVEWATPSESDFDLPEAAQEVLDAG